MSTFDSAKNILLIEDNPGDARLIEILLRETDLADCHIEARETLQGGFDALSQNKNYTAVLLDLSLPDSHGFNTLEKLLTHFPNNNVIVLTGYSDQSLGIKAVQAGAQDFLVKGRFDADQLGKSLRYSIERNAILKRLEETQRIAKIGNWEYAASNHQFIASDEVYRTFGLSPASIGNDGTLLDLPDKFIAFFKKIHAAAFRETIYKNIEIIRQAEGGKRYVYVQCEAEGNAGQTTFQGIIQDITDRELAERKSRKSQQRYQEIFTQSKDTIYISTLEGKLVDCNPSTAQLFQLSHRELLLINDFHSLFYPLEKRQELLTTLKKNHSVRDFEIEIERPDGERRSCLISANIQDSEDFSGYNAIVRDITERKQTIELIKARDLARQSAQLKEQFIASISHEMRTPMNAIYGMSHLLRQTNMNQEQEALVSSIHQSSEILLGIINDILEIATIQNGKIEFDSEDFDLNDVLKNLVEVMQYKAREKDLLLDLHIDDKIPTTLRGDKLRLNQILFNLVGNAIKFSDEGTVTIKAKVRRKQKSKTTIRFGISDQGIGIAADKLQSIFESFTRIRTPERIYEGTGLGLSISKSLVEQQGGKIWAESNTGIGSTFFFELSFEIAGRSKKKESLPLDTTINPDLHYHLLLVEDHKLNQIVAKKTIEGKWPNMEVTLAEHGKQAIALLEQKEFDIVLMDVQMPVMDGYEATRRIRESMPPSVARLPILAMTAHAHLAKDEKFKEYGMDDYVLKPFQPEQLFSKIVTWLKKNKIQNQ